MCELERVHAPTRCVSVVRCQEKSALRARARLTGYGVELAIKSTEYKARDDTLVAPAAAAGLHPAQQQRPEDNLRGFNFTRLSYECPYPYPYPYPCIVYRVHVHVICTRTLQRDSARIGERARRVQAAPEGERQANASTASLAITRQATLRCWSHSRAVQ